jgi:Holliday junction resolvase-like predicted endonuclease
MSDCLRNADLSYSFDLHLFDIDTKSTKKVLFKQSALEEFNRKIIGFRVEEAVVFYFKLRGYDVVECFNSKPTNTNNVFKGQTDLIIRKNDEEIFVEVKSFNDSLRYDQFDFIFSKKRCSKSLVVFVVPKKVFEKEEYFDDIVGVDFGE